MTMFSKPGPVQYINDLPIGFLARVSSLSNYFPFDVLSDVFENTHFQTEVDMNQVRSIIIQRMPLIHVNTNHIMSKKTVFNMSDSEPK